MPNSPVLDIHSVIGKIPYRMAFTGGWIDQPFVSQHNPTPPGSMVVVGIEPTFRCMNRSGMATSTREVARKLWNDALPDADPRELVRILYDAENKGKSAPSGSQDMARPDYSGHQPVGLRFRASERLFSCAHRNQQRSGGRALAGERRSSPAHRAAAGTLRSFRKEEYRPGMDTPGWVNQGRTVTQRSWQRTRARWVPP